MNTVLSTLLFSTLIGIVAGLRAMMAPAAVSWAAWFGWLELGPTSLAFFGYKYAPWITSVLALGELVTDQLPTTPSRTVPIQFGTRILVGALCGGAIGADSGQIAIGIVGGVVGAIAGTLGGRAFRGRLARAFGNDHPAAFVEDAIAITAAWLIVSAR